MNSNERCTRKELEAYVGIEFQKPFFYKALNTYFKNPGTPIWNFSAIFLNMYWFMYRKSLIMSLLLFLTFFTLFTLIPIQISVVVLILFCLILGGFGTNIYLYNAEKEIMKLKEYNYMLEEKELLKVIKSKGGTSFTMVIIFYIGQVALISTLLFS